MICFPPPPQIFKFSEVPFENWDIIKELSIITSMTPQGQKQIVYPIRLVYDNNNQGDHDIREKFKWTNCHTIEPY